MAGFRGNNFWIMAQKQASAGTLATWDATKAHKSGVTGGSIGPERTVENLSETDAQRDQGLSYVTQTRVSGEPEVYARPDSIAFWLMAALGSLSTAGTDPTFTHTITPSNTLPDITIWKQLDDTLYESYQDCKVGSISISAEAGAPLTASLGIMGLVPTRLTAAPDNATPQALDGGVPFLYSDATVTLGGGATALIRSFELGIDNNIDTQQTDAITPYGIVEGMREITLGFDLIFEDLTEYNKFHYGGAAGTAVSNTIYTTDATFSFDKDVNTSLAFTIPSLAYQEFPVEPSASGDPVIVSVRAVAQRQAGSIMTATVKNATAATAYQA